MQIINELDFIKKGMIESYALYGNHFNEVNHKNPYDLVTDLDISIEKHLTQLIKKNFPNDNIIGEEFHKQSIIKGRNWTIDPIDGTVNLANNIIIYGIQCSLIEEGSVVLGVIYFPQLNIMCYAEKGKGAYGQHGRMSCSMNTNISDSIVTFGDFSHTNPIRHNHQINVLQLLAPKVSKIRMFGAASYDFYLLANGSTSAHVMFSKNLWDILPGLLISQEAGAVITNLKGEAFSLNDDNLLVSANKTISEQLLKLFN